MELNKRYSAQETEAKWYDHWMKEDYFSSTPDDREAFTIVIPPPNVTGILHMGHMLNNTIQDILIRRARLQGKNACWVPGTDHASIATEAKVVKMLREKGIKKGDISREEFLEHAFEWKNKYGGIILDQLKKLGASCDWNRTRFTMEEKLSKSVIKVFVDLHKKGKIYKGLRMTNWDPEAKTALSNEEVIHKEENSRLFYVKYKVVGEENYVTIATVRPETILGDTAVAVNPTDERYTHLHNKKVIVPKVNREVPIILDEYVDIEFGTGCLKITPAHDPNDYEIGLKHGLEVIDTINLDGTMNEKAQFFIGMDRFEARKAMAKDLEASGHLVRIEDYRNKVGRSERTNAVVEPKLTEQWYMDMKEHAAMALNAVDSGDIRFFPSHFWNTFYNWLNEDNIRDWCISRQLWWGQRIPAYYYKDHAFVAETAEEALVEAKEKTGDASLTIADLRQDEDVIDTWFSSWLWPMSVFDGFYDKKELEYYYPTSVLVTGWDIIFFWVARMIMSGYEYSEELLGKAFVEKNGRMPFRDVYFTGMVRDQKRRKMSKSLGNSPDALALIENYGADGVRFGMISSGSVGNDIIFDAPIDPKTKQVKNESKLCDQGQNFCNKMWNALKLIKGWEVIEEADSTNAAINAKAAEWFENKLRQTIQETEEKYKTYRLSDIIVSLYSFIWGDFCSWYLEMIKPAYGQPIDRKTRDQAIDFFERLMTILHPYMPFVTEEIWHQLKERSAGEDCIVSTYPKTASFDTENIAKVETIKDVVSSIREARASNGVGKNDEIPLHILASEKSQALFADEGLKLMLQKMGVLTVVEFAKDEPADTLNFISGTEKFFVGIVKQINKEEEIEKLEKELERNQSLQKSASAKLSNEKFVSGAPEVVVQKEQQKLADAEARINMIKEELVKLKA